MPQAVISDLVEAGWQDVLEKAADELMSLERLRAIAIGRSVLVAEGDGLIIDGEDAPVGDGDAEDIAGEIFERGLFTLAPRGDVDHPGDLPDMVRQIGLWAEPDESVAEASASQGGER